MKPSDAAAKLEEFARPGDFQRSPDAYRDLETKVKNLQQALEVFAASQTAGSVR